MNYISWLKKTGRIMQFCLPCLLTSLAISMSQDALAIKASPDVVNFSQPDGSIVKVRIYGDERSHYTTNLEGFVVVENEKGFLEYAVANSEGMPIASGYKADMPAAAVDRIDLMKGDEFQSFLIKKLEAERATVVKAEQVFAKTSEPGEPKYRFSSSAFPVSGEPHSIVVLIEYPDYSFSMEDPHEYYDDFLNGENFSRNGGTGSTRQYFIDNSNGIFKPTFDVYGPVMMKNERRYYGRNTSYMKDANAYQMVVEAVEFLDDTVDFSQYDHNDDGYVDSIYLIYADKGEANGGSADTVWPHSWSLEDAKYDLVVDGVKVSTYGCSNEIRENFVEGIGTFTHEFCHVMGLPDLYNTYNAYDPSSPGKWSVLDAGPYNNDGKTPPNMSAFEKYSLGWISPEEIKSSGDYVLKPMLDSDESYILTSEENPDEFFIMENRQRYGADIYLPGHGMLIWHIEYNQIKWDYNTVNVQMDHHNVDLVRADDKASSSTLREDPFPGRANVTEFSTETQPRLVTWDRKKLNVTSIYDITETEEELITFSVTVTEERGEPTEEVENGVQSVQLPANLIIEGNNVFTSEGVATVYDICGRKVGEANPSHGLSLGKGVYLTEGKKFLIK